ncbi:hypothetical protein [Nocardiopsis sp. CNT312]|uniref:hypothetical protein n=1 Tax=Nocardiopsis sp. CNT312 TaxID=1137268 RepID=UPI0012DE6F11|nr:hypothetical protein [Nocardiopsis sp. CNT312]
MERLFSFFEFDGAMISVKCAVGRAVAGESFELPVQGVFLLSAAALGSIPQM